MTKVYCAEILTVGNELLKGSVLNTNAAFLGKELFSLGFNCRYQTVCRDNIEEIILKLREALDRSDLIIVSGGLGPTPDDLTREAVAKYFDVPLIFSKQQYGEILRYYKKRKKKVPLIVRTEAMFPLNSVPLVNKHGIALGFYIISGQSLVVVLPGVPSELQKMYRELVRPLAAKIFRSMPRKYLVVAKMVGISEPEVMSRLKKDFFDFSMEFGIYPEAGEVTIRIAVDSKSVQNRIQKKIRERLRPWLYCQEEKGLAEVVGEILRRHQKKLACAESCTGGMLLSELTKQPGASEYLQGGIMAYSNHVKESLLNVLSKTLHSYGAVSKQTASAMASGVRIKLGTDYSISITGIAGPSGGSARKPVGRVYIGLSDKKKTAVYEFDFWGDRCQVREKAVKKSLELLWRKLAGK